MAIWEKATETPITSEREVRVVNTETGEEGYVSVSWNKSHHPRFFGPVVKLDRVFDSEGFEIAEPKKIVLDLDPAFA